MPKVTIEVPEGFEEVVKQLEQTLQRAQKGVESPGWRNCSATVTAIPSGATLPQNARARSPIVSNTAAAVAMPVALHGISAWISNCARLPGAPPAGRAQPEVVTRLLALPPSQTSGIPGPSLLPCPGPPRPPRQPRTSPSSH